MSRIPRVRLRWLRSRTAQVLAGAVATLGGAALIGWWVVGVTLMAGGLLLGADAVLRDTAVSQRPPVAHEDVLDRWRRAR